jgi:hypothetical protein
MGCAPHPILFPLSMLARCIISEFNYEVEVLGIQPAQNEVDSELCFPVHAAVDEVVGVLAMLCAPHWLCSG